MKFIDLIQFFYPVIINIYQLNSRIIDHSYIDILKDDSLTIYDR